MIKEEDILGMANKVGSGTMIEHGSKIPLSKQIESMLFTLLEERNAALRVATHMDMVVEYIQKAYPEAQTLNAAPILSNMKKWAGRIRGENI